MTDRMIDKLKAAEGRVPWSSWTEFRDEYYQDLGFSEPMPEHVGLNLSHPIGGSSPNWLHYLPEDAVGRLRSTESHLAELSDIIDETYERASSPGEAIVPSEMVDRYTAAMEQYIDTVPHDTTALAKALVCDKVVQQFRGEVNYDEIHRGTDTGTESPTEFPDGLVVTVTAQNERNFEDFEIYTIEDAQDFFGAAYGDSTLMFNRLVQSDRQPDHVVEDVAFDTEGDSWYQGPPPDTSISIVTTDQKGRMDFAKISNPREFFGDSWGNINEVVDTLNASQDGDGYEALCSCESGWRISAGIRFE